MGTWASLVAADDAAADVGQELAQAVLADVDRRFSSYRPDSEISRFNRGEVADPSPQLREVLAACDWLGEESDGFFDIALPDGQGVDVAGYVKGWAGDLAAEALSAGGLGQFALGIGGDWRVHGGHPDGRPWHLAVLDPTDRTRIRATVALIDGALATSGTYERGDHIRTYRIAGQRVGSFTVAGPLLRWADAFATVGYARGDEGLAWVDRFAGYHGAIIAEDGRMSAAEGFPVGVSAGFPELAHPYS